MRVRTILTTTRSCHFNMMLRKRLMRLLGQNTLHTALERWFQSQLILMPLWRKVANSNTIVPWHSNHSVTVQCFAISCFFSHPGMGKKSLFTKFHLQHSLLQGGNRMSVCYDEAYQIIQPYLVDMVYFHCCPRDCVVF